MMRGTSINLGSWNSVFASMSLRHVMTLSHVYFLCNESINLMEKAGMTYGCLEIPIPLTKEYRIGRKCGEIIML